MQRRSHFPEVGVAAVKEQIDSDLHLQFLTWLNQGVNAIEATLDGKGGDERQLAYVFQQSLIVGLGHDPVDTLIQRFDEEILRSTSPPRLAWAA